VHFLIDECLHTSLVQVAHDAGYQADHVNWMGMRSWSDKALMRVVIARDYTFVTNNAVDFRRHYAREPLHAGLVILLPNARPEIQRRLFKAALAHLGPTGDIVNRVLEVDLHGTTVVVAEYDLAAPSSPHAPL
jgi:predicted nuclease of predicted toxin-antitoxin system